MDAREKYVMQKVNRKEKSICPNCIHHNLCIAENNQPCFECNRFIDAHGVTVQEWISVKDRLPGKDEIVTICTEKGFVYAGELIGDTWFLDNDSWTENVTHWMPLPQPPKGE